MKQLHHRSFTLIELLTVIIIISVIAAFAIPNYQRTIERAHRRDAETNLMAIHAANRIFFSEREAYWPQAGVQNLAAINQNLHLSIIANGFVYGCWNPGGGYQCFADRQAAPTYRISINQNPISPGANPGCTGAGCP